MQFKIGSGNAVVQNALNAARTTNAGGGSPFYKAYAGKAKAILREIQYEAEGQLRVLAGHADELVEKALKAGDAKGANDINRCHGLLDGALANFIRISQRTVG